MIDQGILRGHQTDVRIGLAEYSQNRFRRIDANSPSFDQSLFPHVRQFGEGTFHSDIELLLPSRRQELVVRRKIMDKNNVEAINAESLQAILDRTPHAGCRVIDNYVVGGGREREQLAALGCPRCF